MQGQILNLLRAIQREFDLAYLFVTHDIQVVRYMADDVAVMYLGKIMETGPKQTIFDDPRHPYTKALFSAVPGAGPGIEVGPHNTAGRDAHSHRPARRLPFQPALLGRRSRVAAT